MFDRKVFEGKFHAGLGRLAGAEKTVREVLNELSRSILQAVHATENIGYVNQLLGVLTPINRNGAIAFYKHFAGFHYDEATKLFSKKSKKRYDAAHAESMVFLKDPLNNLFSWAQREKLGREGNAFDPIAFKKGFKKVFDKRLQEARDHGMTQSEIFSLLFKQEDGKVGIDVAAIVSVLADMGEVEINEAEEEVLS